jgi:hypothetical protein
MSASPVRAADNQIYYFQIGRGQWSGDFSLRVTNWKEFWRDHIGLRNRFLTIAMVLFQKVTGKPVISSDMIAYPQRGSFGVAANTVRIHKFGLTLYLLKEEYDLDPNGSAVKVRSTDHFGPIPFVFRDSMEYPAVIHAGGTSSTYYMPLLGADWVCHYKVQPDRDHVDAVLQCVWAEAHEIIHRVD